MSPDELARVLDWIADQIDLAIFNPVTHQPINGEQAAHTIAGILRQAAERASQS